MTHWPAITSQQELRGSSSEASNDPLASTLQQELRGSSSGDLL